MPLFFFDFTSHGAIEKDDIGTEFPSLEEAYLDACRSALECHSKGSGTGGTLSWIPSRFWMLADDLSCRCRSRMCCVQNLPGDQWFNLNAIRSLVPVKTNWRAADALRSRLKEKWRSIKQMPGL